MSNPQGPDAQSSGESRDPASEPPPPQQADPGADEKTQNFRPDQVPGWGQQQAGWPPQQPQPPQPPQAPQQPQTAPQAPQQPQVPPQPQQGAPGWDQQGAQAWGQQPGAWNQQPPPGWGQQQPPQAGGWPQQQPPQTGGWPQQQQQQQAGAWNQQQPPQTQILPPDQQQAWGQQQPAGWGQQPYGQPPGQPPQQQAPWAPPGSQPTDGAGKKSRAPLIVLAVVVAVLVAVGIVGFVTPGLFVTRVFDTAAVQSGVQKVLSTDYKIEGVGDVQCPANVQVKVGETFTCTTTVNGKPANIQISIKSADGNYEVGRPS